jgi:hypothetical protein
MGLLDKERTIAPPGYDRWLVPPAALAIPLAWGVWITVTQSLALFR